jgi:hypothetical protein
MDGSGTPLARVNSKIKSKIRIFIYGKSSCPIGLGRGRTKNNEVIGDSLVNDEITEAVLKGNILVQVASSRANQKGLLGYALVRYKDI